MVLENAALLDKKLATDTYAAAAFQLPTFSDGHTFFRWSTLRDLAETPIYEPVAAAMAHVATFMNHGAAAIADDSARGARGFRPFAQRASSRPRLATSFRTSGAGACNTANPSMLIFAAIS